MGHMDPFAHILLDGLPSPCTPEEAKAAVQRDLAFAPANASSELTRLVIEINRGIDLSTFGTSRRPGGS
jgi:hypothetical protein